MSRPIMMSWSSGWLACSNAHHKERLIPGIYLWLANQPSTSTQYLFSMISIGLLVAPPTMVYYKFPGILLILRYG